MASVNKVILIGNLGADPEVRYLPNGDAVANVRLATTERWKDKASGEFKEQTEWHRVSFFGRLAEVVSEHLRKGSQIYVEGSIRTRKWQGDDGKDNYSTEIKAGEMKMLGGATGGNGSGGSGNGGGRDANNSGRSQPARNANQGGGRPASRQADDSDIPF